MWAQERAVDRTASPARSSVWPEQPPTGRVDGPQFGESDVPAALLLIAGVPLRQAGAQGPAALRIVVGWYDSDAVATKEALPRTVGVFDDELLRPVNPAEFLVDRHERDT